MGRGRAKAKQTKVARELKYRSVGTDLTSLERELRGSSTGDEHHEVPDPYTDLADKYAVDDDDEDGQYRRSV
ncbi:DUF3073 family protein [Auraticoccus sp. F435]|uniref:DUF3073 family protein n=1 Tax=Auraticoccus cholistanensis TaxID=2656650 RepID=A0A6A9UR76_9ACTN|nr:DUF3073 domain-containing protein [Auraticoccus cholistanensis]MVA75406.1 DUF3073 family protein [Auraticoccus cholistanensis]